MSRAKMRVRALPVLLLLLLWLGQHGARGDAAANKSRQAAVDKATVGVRRGPTLRHGLAVNLTNRTRMRAGDDFAYTLWLRYTQPRLMSHEPQHGDEEVTKASIQLPLDHINPDPDKTWTQVYWRNSASYAAGGPAFVMLSGTADYEPANDWLKEGHMADLARKFKADRFFLTTRFFDRANHPTQDTSTDNLQYLTIHQILYDVSAVLDHLLDEGTLEKGQTVILFGAGFGGAVATWARKSFPDVVHGVVASSPTLEAKYDTFSYFPVVTHAVNWYHRKDMQCENYLRQAYKALESSLSTPAGRRDFNQAFQPCTPFPEDALVSAEDRAHVLGLVAGALADVVQEDEDGPDDDGRPGGDKLAPYCIVLSQSEISPLATLGLLVTSAFDGHCLDTSFQSLVDALAAKDWGSEANYRGLRPWLWLQCRELGQLPTSTNSLYTFPYSERISMSFYRKVCEGAFGEGVTAELVANIKNLESAFGGKKPTDMSHAIFVRGDLDPWKESGPDVGLSGEEVHVLNVLRASHAHDLFPRDDYDPPWMKKTRKAIAGILGRWLEGSAVQAPRRYRRRAAAAAAPRS